MFEPLTQPEPSERGCHWQLHLWSDNGGTYRVKAGLFRRPSILFRPLTPAMPGGMVEPPGTAPGSEPFITGAFITIVPATFLELALLHAGREAIGKGVMPLDCRREAKPNEGNTNRHQSLTALNQC